MKPIETMRNDRKPFNINTFNQNRVTLHLLHPLLAKVNNVFKNHRYTQPGIIFYIWLLTFVFTNMFYAFKGFIPVVHPTAYVHPQAAVTGNVIIGKDVYIGPGAALRGDWGGIVIEDGCNVQENCTIHMFPGVTVRLMEAAHIGHGAIIHGATIGRNVLVGMNAVIMDEVEIGDESIIGALSFIAANTKIPARSLVVGNPGKVIKQVSDDMISWKTKGTQLYQSLPADLYETLIPCQPLTELPADRPTQESLYATWNKIKNS